MSDSPSCRRRIAGYNQFLKLIHRPDVKKVYLANDADIFFSEGVKAELAKEPSVALDTSYSSEALAEMAGVDVPTAVITELQ